MHAKQSAFSSSEQLHSHQQHTGPAHNLLADCHQPNDVKDECWALQEGKMVDQCTTSTAAPQHRTCAALITTAAACLYTLLHHKPLGHSIDPCMSSRMQQHAHSTHQQSGTVNTIEPMDMRYTIHKNGLINNTVRSE